MKTTIKITPPQELHTLTPNDQLVNMGYVRDEYRDKRGKKVITFSKDGVDYVFRGQIPQTGEIELWFED